MARALLHVALTPRAAEMLADIVAIRLAALDVVAAEGGGGNDLEPRAELQRALTALQQAADR